MGSGASIIDPGHIKASTDDSRDISTSANCTSHEGDEVNDGAGRLSQLLDHLSLIEEGTNSPTTQGRDLESVSSEKFSIFEEPIDDSDLEGIDGSASEGKEPSEERSTKRLSRNILSGEVQGNVLRATFSMQSRSPTTSTNEYLLKPEGNTSHATSPAEVRRSMHLKLSNELPPAKSMFSIEGLPNLQEIKHKKTSMETYSSLTTNFVAIPPIGKPFIIDKAVVN